MENIIFGVGTQRSSAAAHRPDKDQKETASLKSTIFWDMTPCSPLKVNRRFGGSYSLHLQFRKINRARNQRESRCQAELGGYKEYYLLGYDAMQSVGSQPTFRRNILPCLSPGFTALLATCFHAGSFLGLFFDSEDRGDMFLRNVG
jgi:hypothetical protein